METKTYVYVGVKEGKKLLLDTFILPEDIDDWDANCLLFKKAKNFTYGMGELVDIETKEKGYRLKPTGEYLSGHEKIMSTYKKEDFAVKARSDQEKSLKKSRKDSFKIENMTIGYLLEMESRKDRKAIIIWLISKLR